MSNRERSQGWNIYHVEGRHRPATVSVGMSSQQGERQSILQAYNRELSVCPTSPVSGSTTSVCTSTSATSPSGAKCGIEKEGTKMLHSPRLRVCGIDLLCPSVASHDDTW
eukprot:1194517-Prorocentrum_minimum.AAC.5